MKKFLMGAALIAGTAGAQAADLPRKTPVYKAPILVAYNWTGFYFGVNGGGSVGRDRTRVLTPFSAEQTNLSPLGAIGGGQIGYNWQFSNWLLGLEADIQASGQRDSYTCLLSCTAGTSLAFNQKIDWFGTARARLGYVTGPVLTYVTGGFAFGGVNTTAVETITPPAVVAVFPPVTGPVALTDKTRTGFTLGSGLEASLGGNWTGKIEYLYLNLGTETAAYTFAGVPHTYSSRIRDHIFRAGLNYRIGGVGAYTPEPVANWNGFYLGVNAGSILGRNRSALTIAPVLAERFYLVPDGFLAGAQIGYNWQASNWLFGIEGDFQGSTARDRDACVAFCTPATSVGIRQTLPYLGTARGRVGYFVGSTLFYGTGGYAHGQVRTRLTETAGGIGTAVLDFKRSKGGYAAGGGIESPFQLFGWFGPSWTAKTEYLYVDLGRVTNNFVAGGFAQTFTTRVTEHVFRTGINYHFNSPVVAKY